MKTQFLFKTFQLFVYNNRFLYERTEEKEVQLSICFDWQNNSHKYHIGTASLQNQLHMCV
jgi:hypothetical protein